jgi:dihydrolipoamide dehydrogenase
MTDLTCDVVVIGAGTSGLAAERSARRAGARTLLIDDRFAGTTCATVGCMPSKLLIAAAHAAHAVRSAAVFGIDVPAPRIDGPAVMRRVQRERDAFVAGALKSMDQIPDGIRVQARARFVGPSTLALSDGRRVVAKAVVIATGARPHVDAMFKALGDCVLTNETVFDLTDLPKSLAVVGAGPLGLELAQAMSRLGVDCMVFDQGDKLASLHDDKVAAELRRILEPSLPVHLKVELRAERDGDGDGARLSWTGASTGSKTFERVLVATGRPPQLDGLDLAASGLKLGKHGEPEFDRDTLQCGSSPVFMAGDADADVPVLHEASSEGAIAGRNAASFPTVSPSHRCVPFSIMFTDPPLAVLGKPPGDDAVIGSASYADQGRAKVEARNAGLVHLHAARPDGRLTGAVLLGPGADHIAHLIAWAIERGETATAVLGLPIYHPTFEEGIKSALRGICDTVHASIPSDFDEGSSPGA